MNRQDVKSEFWDEFYQELQNPSIEGKSAVSNSGEPTTQWMRKVVEKIRISEVADEYDIRDCPVCKKYIVNFNDARGWFCCQDQGCKFSGNLVDFFMFMEELK